MWESHYVDPEAYKLLEDRSKESFELLLNLAGNRPDFEHIMRNPDWNTAGPLKKTDIANNFEDIVNKLNKVYEDIDDQIIDIRIGVRANVTPTGEGGLVYPKSILDIENGIKTDKIFFYGLNSVIGRTVANSIDYKMRNDLSFEPINLSTSIVYRWGSVMFNSPEKSGTPKEYFEKSVIREGLKRLPDGYQVRKNIYAKIVNLTNIPDKPLKLYMVIAESLSQAGHYKSLFKTAHLVKATKSLF